MARATAAVYERAQTIGLPVMIHTGTSIFPGHATVYAQPILADDVAVDYPDLVIILAHGVVRSGWTRRCSSSPHKNVYMDISSIPPQKLLLEYFPRSRKLLTRCFRHGLAGLRACGRGREHCEVQGTAALGSGPTQDPLRTTLRACSPRLGNAASGNILGLQPS